MIVPPFQTAPSTTAAVEIRNDNEIRVKLNRDSANDTLPKLDFLPKLENNLFSQVLSLG
jgi:hypothetical protein